MAIVLMGWALFYFEDMGALGAFFAQAFSFTATGVAGINIILAYAPLFLVGALAATPLAARLWQKIQCKTWAQYTGIAVAAVLMLLCVTALVSQSYNPFIYFRF